MLARTMRWQRRQKREAVWKPHSKQVGTARDRWARRLPWDPLHNAQGSGWRVRGTRKRCAQDLKGAEGAGNAIVLRAGSNQPPGAARSRRRHFLPRPQRSALLSFSLEEGPKLALRWKEVVAATNN